MGTKIRTKKTKTIRPKATKRIELIFSHAVSLQQSGRLRSIIFCQRTSIYILNQDRTVLIHFPLNKTGTARFQHPISFKANDYDSNDFMEKDDHIVFRQRHGNYRRDKSCHVPGLTGKDVIKIYKKLNQQGTKKNRVSISKDFLKCLDENLTHLEFQGCKGKLICRQRSLYSGSVITITKEPIKKTRLFTSSIQAFPVMGLRTLDFMALFSFADVIYFYFAGNNTILFESKTAKIPFNGIISRCIYDELGVDNHGR